MLTQVSFNCEPLTEKTASRTSSPVTSDGDVGGRETRRAHVRPHHGPTLAVLHT